MNGRNMLKKGILHHVEWFMYELCKFYNSRGFLYFHVMYVT